MRLGAKRPDSCSELDKNDKNAMQKSQYAHLNNNNTTKLRVQDKQCGIYT